MSPTATRPLEAPGNSRRPLACGRVLLALPLASSLCVCVCVSPPLLLCSKSLTLEGHILVRGATLSPYDLIVSRSHPPRLAWVNEAPFGGCRRTSCTLGDTVEPTQQHSSASVKGTVGDGLQAACGWAGRFCPGNGFDLESKTLVHPREKAPADALCCWCSPCPSKEVGFQQTHFMEPEHESRVGGLPKASSPVPHPSFCVYRTWWWGHGSRHFLPLGRAQPPGFSPRQLPRAGPLTWCLVPTP